MLWIVLFSSIIGSIVVLFFIFREIFKSEKNHVDLRDLAKCLLICVIFAGFSYSGIKEVDSTYYSVFIPQKIYYLIDMTTYEYKDLVLLNFSDGTWKKKTIAKNDIVTFTDDSFHPTYVVYVYQTLHKVNRRIRLILTFQDKTQSGQRNVFFVPYIP